MLFKSSRYALLTSMAAAAGVLLAGPAMAGTTANVPLSGTVTSTLDVAATPTAAATTLVLSSGTEQIVQIADIVMHTNNEQGYTLTANQDSLTKTGGTAIPYQVVVVNDGAAAPLTAAFAVASGTNYTYATAAANAAAAGARDLYLRYTPAALQDPGTYTGTVTLTVADNL